MVWGGRRVNALRTERDRWSDTLDGPARPDEHSSLAADDTVFPSLPCSSIAWAGIGAATAAFDRALKVLEDSPHDPVPVLAELRTATVHASHALTVLAPARRERILYALRIVWTAHRGPDRRSESLEALAPFRSPLVVREVERLLEERHFGASPRWSDLSSVRIAGTYLRQRATDPDLHEATVRFLWDTPSHEHAVRDDVVTCAETVASFVDRALELWQVRRTAPRTPDQVETSVFGSPTSGEAERPATQGADLLTGRAPGALAATTIGAVPVPVLPLPGRRRRAVGS